jgi:TPR repeat protein
MNRVDGPCVQESALIFLVDTDKNPIYLEAKYNPMTGGLLKAKHIAIAKLAKSYAYNVDGWIGRQEQLFKWNRQAAHLGVPEAQFFLGFCYLHGSRVDPNALEGIRWYQKAANQEHKRAQYHLGICYKTGRGVDCDYNEAFRWHERAARGGDPQHKIALAQLYENGKGTPQDLAKARELYGSLPDNPEAIEALQRL